MLSELKPSEPSKETFILMLKELAFQKRLSGVVFKPLYAACVGNKHVVSDKEKREARFL